MAELGRQGQRYRTLAAFDLKYDDGLEKYPQEAFSIDPPRHRPVIGDIFSCELIMRFNGDGTGRIRGWPKRSVYYDKVQAPDGNCAGEGYEGVACMDGAITAVRAGREAFLNIVAEDHSEERCYAPLPCFARVRLIMPGQTFTAAHTIDAEHRGTARMKSQAGDLELCFHGSFGNYCHIMRRVPVGACCPDPAVGEGGCVIGKKPEGNWWDNHGDNLNDRPHLYARSWYRFFNFDGVEEVLSEEENEEENEEEGEQENEEEGE